MSCKKIWWNLPKSINLNFKWFNLPAQLDNYLNNLMIEKPNCYNSVYPNGHSKFLWWNLPKQIEKLCEIEACEEPLPYNFVAKSTDWGSIVDAESFKNYLEGESGESGNVVTDFSIVGDVLSCNITNITEMYLYGLNIYELERCSIDGLLYLNLGNNQIVTFNPTIALPSTLQSLNLGFNQMTLMGYTNSEVWANSQPSFTNICSVFFDSNIDSASGTNLETILTSKNCNVIV